MHVCGSAMALLGATQKAATAPLVAYERVLLVDSHDNPLRIDGLNAEQEYLFFYPYVSTPAFLIDLGKAAESVDLQTETGASYHWRGGIGPRRSVVAFCAICAHRMSHPTAMVSFIGYRREPVGFVADNNRVVQRGAVIQCCSEHSIYDPAQGAKVMAGPAPQPLATIALEYEDSLLYASGVYGGVLYDRFFDNFGFRLALEFGPERVRQQVSGTAVVQRTEDYTRQRIRC